MNKRLVSVAAWVGLVLSVFLATGGRAADTSEPASPEVLALQLQAENAKLKTDLAQRDADLAAQKTKLAVFEKLLAAQADEIAAQQAELRNLVAQLTAQTAQLNDLETQKHALEAEKESLTIRLVSAGPTSQPAPTVQPVRAPAPTPGGRH